MTQHYSNPPPGDPQERRRAWAAQQGRPQPPVKTPHRSTWWRYTLTAAAAMLAGLVIGLAVSGDGTAEPPSPLAGTEATQASEPALAPEPEPVIFVPAPDDFTLSVKTLRKKCFGSAGCNITFRIEPTYAGSPLDPSVTLEVIYEVRGGEDGPQINTMTVTGDSYSVDAEERISTASSADTLTAVVTDVSAR